MNMMKKLIYIAIFIFLGLFFAWLFKAKAAEGSVTSEEGITTEMGSETGEMDGNETGEIESEKPVEEIIPATSCEVTPEGGLASEQLVEEDQSEEMMPASLDESTGGEVEEEMSPMEEEMPEE